MVERVFSTIYFRMSAIMMHMVIHYNLKTGIWPKVTETTSKLEITMVPLKKKNVPMSISAARCQTRQKYLNYFSGMGAVCIFSSKGYNIECVGIVCVILIYAEKCSIPGILQLLEVAP